MLKTNKNPRFSVIIPAYNVEKYIGKAIESVKKQTFKNLEIIVVEDCSTDDTKKEIKKYKNDIILVQHKINKCLGGARNSGMRVAKGDYIIFLDGDDFLNNDKVLEKLDNLIGNQKVDVVYMGFTTFGKKNITIIPTEETCSKSYRIAGDRYANAWSKCWNREFLIRNNLFFPENRYYEDVLFIYNAVTKVERYLIADFPVHTYYSGRTNSITSTLNFKNIYDNMKNIEDLVNIRNNNRTEELDIKIEKEVNRCKERMDELMSQIRISSKKV